MFKAKLDFVKNEGSLSFASFSNDYQSFYMLATDLDLSVAELMLDFKASDVIITKEPIKSSISNEIRAKITSLDEGKICSVLKLENEFCDFEAILSRKSSDALKLKLGDEVFAYVKANALFIESVL